MQTPRLAARASWMTRLSRALRASKTIWRTRLQYQLISQPKLRAAIFSAFSQRRGLHKTQTMWEGVPC